MEELFKDCLAEYRHKGYTFINIAGLAAGIACCMLIMLYVRDELSFDRYHEKIDRLYRLERTGVFHDQVYHSPITAHPTAPSWTGDLPEIRHAVRIWPRELTVRDRENHFFEEKILFTDPVIFDTFTFPLLKGSASTALKTPNSIVLNEKMSHKYFNSSDSLGKILSVKWNDTWLDFKITGVMKELPKNSHFRTDFFASYSTLDPLMKEQVNQWLSNSIYTYFLLPQHLSPRELERKFPALVEKYMGTVSYQSIKAALANPVRALKYE